MIKLRIKLRVIVNLFDSKPFFDPEFRKFLNLIIYCTLVKKVRNVIIHIVIRTVLIIDQYDFWLMENVKIVEIIMTKFNLLMFVFLIMYQKFRSEVIYPFIFLLDFLNELLE